jgi:hypothetical protein
MKIPIVNRADRKTSQALDFSKLDVAALRKGRDAAFARARDHSPPITRVCPVSRAIPLGGKPRVASELRIADLAELQAWLEEQVPHSGPGSAGSPTGSRHGRRSPTSWPPTRRRAG